jgi:signal transduction histidine kinase
VSGKRKIGESRRDVIVKRDASATDSQAYDMAGSVAHDLNTILTTIYGYSEQALDWLDDDSEAARSVRKIIEAADRARKLTGQLLEFSRSSSLEKVAVRLGDVLSETLDFIIPVAGSNITVIRQYKAPDLLVEAVPEQLFRVFMNITVNALHSMEENGGNLTVTLDHAAGEELAENGSGRSRALIRFEDTGKGMDPETASRMFEPFFTSGKKEAGTGLGLTIVWDIVNEMGGTLKVSSEIGKGTVIQLLFPVSGFGSLPENPYLRIPEE